MIREDIKLIKETFQEVSDLVTPTMGAKGRLAMIHKDMDRPTLTDDGVTVARECFNMKGIKRSIAVSVIEAAATTEREAYDGTTLTILMVNELYKFGLSTIKQGIHPQQAADYVQNLIEDTRKELQNFKIEPTEELLKSLATISTKIPVIGDIVYEAHKAAGDDMNVIIEHDREGTKTLVEHVDGMVLESGYFSEVMRSFTNDGNGKTVFEDATIVMLSAGFLSQMNIQKFFESIPSEGMGLPFVFIITPKFNPESLQYLLQILVENKFQFQFVFLNEEFEDELFLDLAAKTGGKIQDAALNSLEYKYGDCGYAKKIVISKDQTIITGTSGDASDRIKAYKKELKKDQYTIGVVRYNALMRRLGALEKGVTKIKLVAATVTEYQTIRLKLDDAIGAVKCAIRDGLVAGSGKPLFILAQSYRNKNIRRALEAPLITILENAGLKQHISVIRKEDKKHPTNVEFGVDVKANEFGNLVELGIVDSYTSVDSALKNAASVASQYLRAYTLIGKE